MTADQLTLTPEVLDDLERTLRAMAERSALFHVPALVRAVLPHVSQETREMLDRAFATAEPSTQTIWTALYADATTEGRTSDPHVPGEITLDDRGGFAFDEAVIRRLVAITDGALDLRRWLAVVPKVHATFAVSGAEKIVSVLQSTSLVAEEALLDAFAIQMAEWARTNDPALELSATALP